MLTEVKPYEARVLSPEELRETVRTPLARAEQRVVAARINQVAAEAELATRAHEVTEAEAALTKLLAVFPGMERTHGATGTEETS